MTRDGGRCAVSGRIHGTRQSASLHLDRGDSLNRPRAIESITPTFRISPVEQEQEDGWSIRMTQHRIFQGALAVAVFVVVAVIEFQTVLHF
jgi:hypothetical protein